MEFKHTSLWNDLPTEERKRLHPHMIETHILHLEQTKLVIMRNHRRLIRDINDHIKSLQEGLRKAEKEKLIAEEGGDQ